MIETGIGEKLALTVQQLSMFLAGIFIGFIYGWELALIMCCSIPILVTILGLLGRVSCI